MVSVDEVKSILSKYDRSDIIITDHAEERARFRDIDFNEIRKNIINPERLNGVIEEKAEKPDERKFDCYFAYGQMHAHRYVLAVNNKCIVCTVIDVRRDWQAQLEGKK